MTGTRDMRILLIDSEPGEVAHLQSAFHSCEANPVFILQVSSLDDALPAMNAQAFDVIFIAASKSNGVADVLCIRAAAPICALIALCGQEDEPLAVALLQAGAQDCLFKSQLTPQLLSRAARYAMERVHTQEQLVCLAQYDGVIGLPNRSLFRDRLTQSLIHAQRKGMHVAVMFIDLDYFKSVNDML